MALTKIPRGLLDTGIADSSDATAITINSSENVTFAGTATAPAVNISAGTPVLTLTDTSSSATTTITLDGVDTTIDSNGTDGDLSLIHI